MLAYFIVNQSISQPQQNMNSPAKHCFLIFIKTFCLFFHQINVKYSLICHPERPGTFGVNIGKDARHPER